MQQSSSELTRLLQRWGEGERGALDDILPRIYDTLREVARRRRLGERSDASLNTTALVHETYLKLAQLHEPAFRDRSHFLAMASRVMRRLLVDHARARKADKRGQGDEHLQLDDDFALTADESTLVQDLNEALEELATVDLRASLALEYHYFGGLTIEETADVLRISSASAKRDLRFAKAWLAAHLGGARLAEEGH
jgi:RNA polymerase sigma factor (TIGR02999 family)